MGKPTKLRNRLPNKPASSSADTLEERLNKIETIQARNTSNVFKYAFFFFMGVGLTMILYPEISVALAGLRESSITLTESEETPGKEVIVEQEYNLDDDTEEVEDAGASLETQRQEESQKPNKTTFKYSNEQDDSLKSVPLTFDNVDNGEKHASNKKSNEDNVKQNAKIEDNGKAIPVKFERFENIEDADNYENDETANKDTRLTQNTDKHSDVKRKPTKARQSDPLEGENEAEETLKLKTVDPRKDKQVHKVTKATGNNAKKTVVKEVKIERPESIVDEQKSVNMKTKRSSQQKSPKNMETKNEQKLPKEILEFNATILKGVTPKKIFADGRRIPPTELLPQKPNNSSVK